MRSEAPGARRAGRRRGRMRGLVASKRNGEAFGLGLGLGLRRCNGLAAKSSAGSGPGTWLAWVRRGPAVGQRGQVLERAAHTPVVWGPGNVRHAALAPTRPGATQKPAIVAPTEPQGRSGTSSHSHAAPCRRTPEPRQPWKHTTLPPTGTAMGAEQERRRFPPALSGRHSNYTMNNGRLGSLPAALLRSEFMNPSTSPRPSHQ